MSAPQPRSISLLIVAEIRLFRDGLAEVLSARRAFDIVGTASHLEEALPLLRDLRPEIALVDVAQPAAVGAVRAIVDAAPEVRLILLAVPELEPEVVRWAEEGTAGYVPRDAGIAQLEACVARASQGGRRCTRPGWPRPLFRRIAALAAERRPEPLRSKLTLRERWGSRRARVRARRTRPRRHPITRARSQRPDRRRRTAHDRGRRADDPRRPGRAGTGRDQARPPGPARHDHDRAHQEGREGHHHARRDDLDPGGEGPRAKSAPTAR